MKVLPCRPVVGGVVREGCGDAVLPDGKPYLLPSFPGSGTFTYKCSKCKKKTILLASEFARLPETNVGEEG